LEVTFDFAVVRPKWFSTFDLAVVRPKWFSTFDLAVVRQEWFSTFDLALVRHEWFSTFDLASRSLRSKTIHALPLIAFSEVENHSCLTPHRIL